MSVLRVLHLSDPHLVEKRRILGVDLVRYMRNPFICSPGNDQLARVVAITAKELEDQFDLVIVNGDMANTGWEDDLERARRFVVSEVVGEGLGATKKPISLIPGNHDRYRNDKIQHHLVVGAGGGIFDKVFAKEWSVEQGTTAKTLSKNPSVVAVFVDFTLRAEDAGARPVQSLEQAYGNGSAYPDLCEQVSRLTEQAGRAGSGVIWVMHFAPWFAGLPSLLRLLDEENLPLKSCSRWVSHILCGHTHVPRRYRREDIEIVCTGSCTKDSTLGGQNFPQSFLILELQDGGSRLTTKSCRRFEWSNASHDFLDVGELPFTQGLR